MLLNLHLLHRNCFWLFFIDVTFFYVKIRVSDRYEAFLIIVT